MATDGCLNTPEHVVDTISVDAFLKGCSDKKAALFAMEKIQQRLTRLYHAQKARSIIRRYYLDIRSQK